MVSITAAGSPPDGDSITTNPLGELQVDPDWLNLHSQNPDHEIEIMELQAATTATPLSHDSLICDTFSDSGGYLNTVSGAVAVFDTSKYKPKRLFTEQASTTLATPQTTFGPYRGVSFTTPASPALTLKTVTANTNATRCFLMNSGKTTITDVAMSAGSATFNYDLTPSTTYWIATGIVAGSATHNKGSFAISDTYISFTGTGAYGMDGAGAGTNEAVCHNILTAVVTPTTPIAQTITIALPTITGTVIASQLIVHRIETETGDSVTYALTDGAAHTDANLAEETYNAISTLTGVPETLTITLNPKASSPTEGYPSIRTYVLKLWKA